MSARGRILLFVTLIDSFATGIGVHMGVAKEFNPIMAWLLANGGEFLFIMFRAMFVMFFIARLDRLASLSGEGESCTNRLYNLAIFTYVTALIIWTGAAQLFWMSILHHNNHHHF